MLPTPRFIALKHQTLGNELVMTRLSPTNEQLIAAHAQTMHQIQKCNISVNESSSRLCSSCVSNPTKLPDTWNSGSQIQREVLESMKICLLCAPYELFKSCLHIGMPTNHTLVHYACSVCNAAISHII